MSVFTQTELDQPTHGKSAYNATLNTYSVTSNNQNIKQQTKFDGDGHLETESDKETSKES